MSFISPFSLFKFWARKLKMHFSYSHVMLLVSVSPRIEEVDFEIWYRNVFLVHIWNNNSHNLVEHFNFLWICSYFSKFITLSRIFLHLWLLKYYFVLQFCLYKSGSSNRILAKTLNYLLLNLQFFVCFIILALNLVFVSNTRFISLLLSPASYSLDVLIVQYTEYDVSIEHIFIFITSTLLWYVWFKSNHGHFEFLEFSTDGFLVLFFWIGYCCK